jgi:flagellin
MSSILTNNSAMVALQTLQGVNSNLAKTQDMISTGKSVGSAKDNAAVFAISKVMESDVSGFKAISDSLSLGESTVAVGRQAAETVTDLLTEMKGKIVAAQEDNVDRSKIQTDIKALTDQIKSVTSAAQFNGLNLTNGTQQNSAGAAQLDILSSLDRASDGTVQSNKIAVDLSNTNLSTGSGTALADAAAQFSGTVGTGSANAGPLVDGTAATLDTFAFLDDAGAAGTGTALRPSDSDVGAGTAGNGLVAGDQIKLDVGGVNVSYTVREGDTGSAISGGLRGALESSGLSGDIGIDASSGDLVITNNTGDDLDLAVSAVRGSGGLAPLETLSVDGTDADRNQALNDIETMIQFSVDAAAEFGSAQIRIETQSEFVSKLTDSLTSGIGSLVDANMEEASARLQALQVQQQLATQSLSIANQAPQALLSLFRG